MTQAEAKLISVVVPVYCEQEVLPEFYRRTHAMLAALPDGLSHELIFVNDGSTDRSLDVLTELQSKDPAVRIVDLSRNFGHQKAITAGIDHATGDAVVLIDADLQDPPEVIPQMIEQWRQGAHVVYGVRKRRPGESGFKLATAWAFYRLLNKLSDIRLPTDSGDFRLMDRLVVDALHEIREENRYLRGLIAWLGFTQIALPYDRDVRTAGESKYPLFKMMRLAVDGITGFSERPLRFATFLGFCVMAASALLTIWAVIARFVYPDTQRGWASLMVAILFLGGTQLLSVGILGEYIGRIYRESKRRPLYVVKKKIGIKSADSRKSCDV